MEVTDELISEACEALTVTLTGPLRDGGQKAVRRVRRGGEELVLKVITLSDSSPGSLRRAEREVQLLSKLDSPHVVKVRSDLLQLGDPVVGACWLEEYIEGQDLTELLGPPWSWAETAALIREVALGLGVAHQLKVVHRDLSSNNVRRRSDGNWVVLDFGFARHTLRSGLTVAGHPGTLGFLTPEHLNGYSGGPTAASDVFGVGLLAFFALTGTLPITADDDEDYLTRLLRCRIPDIAGRRPDLEPEQAKIVMRCLHPQSARRYLNGRRLAAAIEALS